MSTEITGLLTELKTEREKYTESDNDKMQKICNRLVELGHYPEKSGIGYDSLTMVESWGVDWNVWQEPLACQHCGADLRNLTSGPPFKREIAQIDGWSDRTVAIQCPDCQKDIWQRPVR